MNFKKLTKGVKKDTVVICCVAVALVVGFFYYSRNKSIDSMMGINNSDSPQNSVNSRKSSNNVRPAGPLGTNEVYASAKGIQTTTQGLPSSCTQQRVADPSELLPQDQNNAWAQLNPTGTGDLQNVNLLKAGYHIGINTVGQSLRNANLQIRSEPANPQGKTGPWNTSTIEPDSWRPALEVGACSK